MIDIQSWSKWSGAEVELEVHRSEGLMCTYVRAVLWCFPRFAIGKGKQKRL